MRVDAVQFIVGNDSATVVFTIVTVSNTPPI